MRHTSLLLYLSFGDQIKLRNKIGNTKSKKTFYIKSQVKSNF